MWSHIFLSSNLLTQAKASSSSLPLNTYTKSWEAYKKSVRIHTPTLALTYTRWHVYLKAKQPVTTNTTMTFLIFDFVAPKIQVTRGNVLDWKFDVLSLEETEKR